MKPRLGLLAALASFGFMFACTPAGPPAEAPSEELLSEAEARAIVEEMNDQWDAAVVSGDFEAASAMYTTDAIRMQPDMPALVGREAIRAWLQSESDTYTFEGANQILEVHVLSPEWILMSSTGSFTMTPKAGGEAKSFQEKWLTIVQRQPDGTWKWYRDAGNSDLPRQ